MNASERVLYYFADPMCSWCWGFSPVIESIKANYGDVINIALILGGLRPLNTEPMTPSLREEILHHWHEVERRTGQVFQFESALPEGFIYDTEPPSRAVVVMGELNSAALFPYFKTLQTAFYAQGRDVTRPEVLLELTAGYHIDESQFQRLYDSDEIKSKTLAHFQRARHFGVRGFPTLILQEPAGYHLVTRGYRDFESLQPELSTLLAA